jgi:hypothetical protein
MAIPDYYFAISHGLNDRRCNRGHLNQDSISRAKADLQLLFIEALKADEFVALLTKNFVFRRFGGESTIGNNYLIGHNMDLFQIKKPIATDRLCLDV